MDLRAALVASIAASITIIAAPADAKPPSGESAPRSSAPDNDQDGHPDRSDLCPGIPENRNGFRDYDGCPDEIPAAVQQITGVIEDIEFRRGSARIRRRAKPALDGVASVLRLYPHLRIEIRGYPDNGGFDEGDRKLARKRSNYAKWYLVDQNIDASRMEAVGVGPDPTGKMRAPDARIDFRLIPEPAPGSQTGGGGADSNSGPASPATR